jgi:hypothetical protein
MPFQFMCPQGHLLEGQESQMGQQTQCPLCHAVMIIPVVAPQSSVPQGPPAGYPGVPAYGAPAPAPGHATWPAQGHPAEPHFPGAAGPTAPAEAFPQLGGIPAFDAQAAVPPEIVPGVPPPGEPSAPEPEEPKIVRILCPNNHELHTPMDMVGQDAMCPQCNVQFRLRYEDSLEYKEEKKKAQVRREQRFSNAALKWAIVAATIVVLSIILMIAISASGGLR